MRGDKTPKEPTIKRRLLNCVRYVASELPFNRYVLKILAQPLVRYIDKNL